MTMTEGQGLEGIDAWRALARTHQTEGNVSGEIAAWQHVLAIQSEDGEAAGRLSHLLFLEGREHEAIPYLKMVAAGSPEDIKRWAMARADTLATRLTALDFPDTKYHRVPTIYGRAASKLVDIRADPLFYSLAQQVLSARRTLLYFDRLFTLYQVVSNMLRSLPPDAPCRMLEVGAYKGGSSFFLAAVAQALHGNRIEQYAIDTFEGHAAADLPDAVEGAHLPRMFSETDYQSVAEYLSTFDFIRVLKGRVQDLHSALPKAPYHFIHLDVDIYAPTIFVLRSFYDLLAPRGMIVVDDYGFVTCPGVRRAVQEYLDEYPQHFIKLELMTGQCLLIK
jgi:predicted O-methyltransferase YrrM